MIKAFIFSVLLAVPVPGTVEPQSHGKDAPSVAQRAREADQHPFRRLEETVFTPRCGISGCHNGLNSVMGLDLRPGRAWFSLVGRPSREMQGLGMTDVWFLVAPGDPEHSYLLHKLRGEHLMVGEQMPLQGPCLTEEEIRAIHRWIAEGALPPPGQLPPPVERIRRIRVGTGGDLGAPSSPSRGGSRED